MITFDEGLGMPDLTYGWAKLTHEYCARLAYEKHGMAIISQINISKDVLQKL